MQDLKPHGIEAEFQGRIYEELRTLHALLGKAIEGELTGAEWKKLGVYATARRSPRLRLRSCKALTEGGARDLAGRE